MTGLYKALELAQTVPTFKMWIDPFDGRFRFEMGHNDIGYGDGWSPTQYMADLDDLPERLIKAYNDYQHVQKIMSEVEADRTMTTHPTHTHTKGGC
jgi:hypothetical protein